MNVQYLNDQQGIEALGLDHSLVNLVWSLVIQVYAAFFAASSTLAVIVPPLVVPKFTLNCAHVDSL
jgi:hypothetical protein